MTTDILLIDEDKSHADALGVYLERQQFDVYKAGSPDEALTFFDNSSTDIVLADPGLPDTDTAHLLKQIKGSHPAIQLIIMLSLIHISEPTRPSP